MNQSAALNLFTPTIWLSDRLCFQHKYWLIGFVVLTALALLSWPLLQQAQEKSQLAHNERTGLKLFVSQLDALALLINARSLALSSYTHSLPQTLLVRLHALENPSTVTSAVAQQAERLQNSLVQIKDIEIKNFNLQARFAAYTSAINALLGLISDSAHAYRLNVDPALDATFDVLTNHLPAVLDALNKQQDALTLHSDEMTSYALSTQVMLADTGFALEIGIEQLVALKHDINWLTDSLKLLLSGISKQQDTVDMILSDPANTYKLNAIVIRNQKLVLILSNDIVKATDAYLEARITSLQHSQLVITALLIFALSAIAYLFAGIYLSTLHSLKTLSIGTKAFCNGNLEARISINTNDELVLLARNFNTVAAEVERLLAVIHEQNESRERDLENQVLARTIELADKNAQLLAAGLRVQEELQLARKMQLAILPQIFPSGLDWSVHACMFPARELSGDFYDCFPLPGGRYGILVADVSGKGVGAAFFMAVSRTILLNLATTNISPAEVLARGNNTLCEHNPMELFVTACYGVFDPGDGSFIYASAGHFPPLLRLASGNVLPLACSYNIALGIMPTMDYSNHVITVKGGSILLLYTDGVTEAFAIDGEAYGDKRLYAWLTSVPSATAAIIVESLVQDVKGFIAEAEASDDLTCLALCYS